MKAVRYYNLDISEIFLFDNYIIDQIKEGVHVEPYFNDLMQNIIHKYYYNKPFVYITNRVFSDSINPSDYTEIKGINNLIAFAVVTTDKIVNKNTKEKHFFNKAYKIFNTIDEAMFWSDDIFLIKQAEINRC
ncbi:hypothetical protein HSX10_13560 [Winogradskyella undariae]|uniref:hypothetical protein n=1 Tax=Winogradskyella undariae TaxID=1285465 RepID=UPI00156B40F1|nr:hypothetical protein [Winogradskyella undariae]NRR92595.1 hypothetical protein [Winogradskyella undariae]